MVGSGHAPEETLELGFLSVSTLSRKSLSKVCQQLSLRDVQWSDSELNMECPLFTTFKPVDDHHVFNKKL